MVDLNRLVFDMIMTCDEKFEDWMIIGLEVRNCPRLASI